jgi:hypothetical protein
MNDGRMDKGKNRHPQPLVAITIACIGVIAAVAFFGGFTRLRRDVQ